MKQDYYIILSKLNSIFFIIFLTINSLNNSYLIDNLLNNSYLIYNLLKYIK